VEMDKLMTSSLKSATWGKAAGQVMAAALEAVDPAKAIKTNLQREGDRLLVQGKTYDLSTYQQVYLLGAGKAGAPMASAATEILGENISGGLVIVKDGYSGDTSGLEARGVEVVEAGHPIPDQRGRAATAQMIHILDGLRPDDLAICLISGGGSALMHHPAGEISLEDLQQLTSILLAVGADITEINTLRKHLDRIKGGGLARAAAPAEVLTLILSDVIGDPLDVIASGPTVPDSSTFHAAWQVLERYQILEKIPARIRDHLQRGVHGEIQDSPKAGDPIFEKVANFLVGNNSRAAQAAAQSARAAGYHSLVLTSRLQGEARRAGRALGALARQFWSKNREQRYCLIAGGETTVTILGDGRGGRNQELALGAIEELAGLEGVGLITLATDGGDGPTDAAGAVVTGDSLARAIMLGLDPRDYLARNDSYHFFATMDDLLKPGPTLTNVNDLAFLFIT
jgi:glycerate 2-kinase